MEILEFNILSYWQVRSGAGDMGTFDARPVRDAQGMPVIPGRQVKGLCRQAVYDAAKLFKAEYEGVLPILFGGTTSAKGEPIAGVLRFDDARLPEAHYQAIAGKPNLIAGLFVTRRNTAMTKDGVARPHSLRFEEMVVPLTLEANVEALAEAPSDWKEKLTKALPLLNAVGSDRTRGLGRVIVKWKG